MIIKPYEAVDEPKLFDLLRSEGDDWRCYTDIPEKYGYALTRSVTYVAYEGDFLCGFSRSVADNGIYMYISDLLVHKAFRNRGIAQALMEIVCTDHPEYTVYVLSDVDEFYRKKGYAREGSVFEVTTGR